MSTYEYMQKTYTLGTNHYKVKVEMQIYCVHGWETDHDLWIVGLDGSKTNATKNYSLIYSCLNSTSDSVSQYVYSRAISHTSNTFTLYIEAYMNAGPLNEAMGFSHIRIKTYYCHPRCVTCNGGTEADCASCDTTKNFILESGNCICDNNYYFKSLSVFDIKGECQPCESRK